MRAPVGHHRPSHLPSAALIAFYFLGNAPGAGSVYQPGGCPQPSESQAEARRDGSTAQAAMNLFRLAGDMSHLLSVCVLLLKIRATKSCRGAGRRGIRRACRRRRDGRPDGGAPAARNRRRTPS